MTEDKKRLRAAWTLAESNSKKGAKKRREVRDKKSTPCAIDIGVTTNNSQGQKYPL